MARGGDTHPTDRSNEAEWLSSRGGVRCARIKRNGKRCNGWSVKGRRFCNTHKGPTQVNAMYRFKTERAAEVFARVTDDPEYLSIREELGLIRTCLQMFIELQEKKRLKKDEELSIGDLAMIAALAKDAATVAESCNRIERGLKLHISVEAMDAFLGQLIRVMTEEIEDITVVERIQTRVLKLELPTGGVRRVGEYPEGTPEREAFEEATKQSGNNGSGNGEANVG